MFKLFKNIFVEEILTRFHIQDRETESPKLIILNVSKYQYLIHLFIYVFYILYKNLQMPELPSPAGVHTFSPHSLN
jgi:hypothetical protein